MTEHGGIPGDREPDERIARYLAGELSAEERLALEREALADDPLAEALYSQTAIEAASPGPPVLGTRPSSQAAAREPAAPPSRATPRWRLWAVALPVAAAVVAGLVLTRPQPPDDVLRGGGTEMRLVAPSGEVPALPLRFEWTAAPEAARYRFELMSGEGRMLYERTVEGTALELAPGDVPETLLHGHWRVVPLDAAGNELPAPAVMEFTIRPAR